MPAKKSPSLYKHHDHNGDSFGEISDFFHASSHGQVALSTIVGYCWKMSQMWMQLTITAKPSIAANITY